MSLLLYQRDNSWTVWDIIIKFLWEQDIWSKARKNSKTAAFRLYVSEEKSFIKSNCNRDTTTCTNHILQETVLKLITRIYGEHLWVFRSELTVAYLTVGFNCIPFAWTCLSGLLTTDAYIRTPSLILLKISPWRSQCRLPQTSQKGHRSNADRYVCWLTSTEEVDDIGLYMKIKNAFLSASLYVSKRGAYWDRLCRDVVGQVQVYWRIIAIWLDCETQKE